MVQLYNAISTNPNDTLIIQGFKRIESNKKIITRTFNNQIYTARNFHLVFEKLNINRSGYPFGKLYNNKIIQQHQIRFIENIHYA